MKKTNHIFAKTGRGLVLVLLSTILWAGSLSAQSFCHFQPTAKDIAAFANISNKGGSSGPYVIRIWVHVVNFADSTGGPSAAYVQTALDFLDADFNPHDVCFVEVGRDTVYENVTSPFNLGTLLASYGHPEAIDCFLLPASIPSGGGLASGIPGEGFTVGGNLFGGDMVPSHVTSHEMGHCMGLWHTFQSGNPSCPELVDGSNCTTCGDFVCDTDADPGMSFNVDTTTCTWNGSGTDANGDPYDPDELNIMSYTQPVCMQYFTNGQGARMRNIIATDPLLQQVCVPDTLYLQNQTISSGRHIFVAKQVIIAGSNVDASQPSGPFIVNGTADVTFLAGNQVSLQPGFEAQAGGSSFTARTQEFCGTNKTRGGSQPLAGARLLPGTQLPHEMHDHDHDHESEGLIAYPNPFGTSTFLEFDLEEAGTVSLSIYNLQGQEVASIKAGEYTAEGHHKIEWNASELSSGMYLCILRTDRGQHITRLVKE